MFKRLLHRLAFGLVTLIVLLYLVFFGLELARLNQAGEAVHLLPVAGKAVAQTGQYLFERLTFQPQTYAWHRSQVSASDLVPMLFFRSAALLLLSLLAAIVLGVPLGIAAARSRKAYLAPLMIALSLLGISVPSFLLAMLLFAFNVGVHNTFSLPALPATGTGFDLHLVLPSLVLAARPLAQITQISYVTFSDILTQDFIRTARAKGVAERGVIIRHALKNGIGPILATITASLRYSLSSLPVVEFFFIYEGAGLVLLDSIRGDNASLTADLILALGIFFVLVHVLHDLVLYMADPRTRQTAHGALEDLRPLREQVLDFAESLKGIALQMWEGVRARLLGARQACPAADGRLIPAPVARAALGSDDDFRQQNAIHHRSLSVRVRNTLAWAPVLVTTGLVLSFFGLAVAGERLTTNNPYATSGVTYIHKYVTDGSGQVTTREVLMGPPFPPAVEFPWGADPMGRDIQAMVLAGTKQTLALALFAVLARLSVGTILGMLSGWWHDTRFDRILLSAAEALAAFPTTLLAMILLFALGIRQGFPVFVIALAVIGWGEITQVVRSKVIAVKSRPYIEGAVATGGRPTWLLTRHVLPNILPELLALSALEMGGVLMILAELGFLNVFIGGGARAAVAEGSRMGALILYNYSDVPEWGALLSNIRDWWHSYPWLALYPGLFFTAAIMAFNMWGEALRGLLERIGYRMTRLINRYTLSASAVLIASLVWVLNSTAPMGLYAPETNKVSADRMMQDIRELSSPRYQGRETDTPGGNAAAQAIADRMQQIGLLPAGENYTFFHGQQRSVYQVTASAALTVTEASGQPAGDFVHHRDFNETSSTSMPLISRRDATQAPAVSGELLALAAGPVPNARTERDQPTYDWGETDVSDKILLVPDQDTVSRLVSTPTTIRGILAVTDDPMQIERKVMMYPPGLGLQPQQSHELPPLFLISQEAAGRLLAGSGTGLAALRQTGAALGAGKVQLVRTGKRVSMGFSGHINEEVHQRYYIIGSIPGKDSEGHLDSQVILIAANYDGLGQDSDGTIYPSANDNASGVAAMLEIARILKQSPYQPRKTIVFVAWAGGTRHEKLSTFEVMNGKPGFNQLTVEAVMELRGVGSGTGNSVLVPEGSSFRLTELLRAAGNRLGVPVTISGRAADYGDVEAYLVGSSQDQSLRAQLSWDGSYFTSNTAADTPESLDSHKLSASTRVALLATMVMSRHTDY